MESSAALAFHREPLISPPPGPLTALLVFGHASETELIKSVHLYTEGETHTLIQQEFRFLFEKYVRVSEPLASMYCSNFGSNSSEQLMTTWKRLVTSEDISWQCILEFHIDLPQAHPLIPLLSVSRNPALNDLPSLAYDLEFVEWELQRRAGVLHDSWFSHHSPTSTSSKQQKFDWPGDLNIMGSYANSTLSAMYVPPQAELVHHHDNGLQNLQSQGYSGKVDAFQQWGSNLELAAHPDNINQGMFNTSCMIGSSWACSEDLCSPSMPGLMTIPSPTSSSISNHDATDNNCWASVAFPTIPPQLSMFEESSLSSQNSLLGFSDNSEASRVGGSGISDSVSAKRSSRSDKERSTERRSSHCSDESVVSLSLVTNKNKQQGKSNRDLNENAHCLTRLATRSEKQQQELSANQRGPTERMMEISLNELSHYFHMPITQASKELKVGLTVLKKRCREFGIPRWPHRKLKSLESLIHNIQELSKDSEGRKNFMDAVRELENQKKSMEESPGIELSERTKRLRQACFKQSYKQRRQALAKLEADFEGVVDKGNKSGSLG